MPHPDADRYLLFGINALQNDFITRDALIAAMNNWVLEKHRTIGEILVERGDLSPAGKALLDQLLDHHLARHGGDAAASLAAMTSLDSVADDLRQAIADPEVLESIAQVSTASLANLHANRAAETVNYIPAGIRYRKVRDHAEGGLGIVSIARDEELNRDVALKEIKAKYADNPDSRTRFVLEAEITGGLEHPGIVPVYGLGHHGDGRPYYAMRFIRGNSLRDAIKAFHADTSLKGDPGSRTLALQKLLRRFLDVCNAVAYAHNRGVLHRDLKPDNVMVGKYGETLVVDWGLAKTVGRSGDDGEGSQAETTIHPTSASGSAETIPGSVIGTPGYMSPEQAAGRLDLLGPASDVYGLGATLYTLLTGQVPFADKDLPEVLRKVERGEFPHPREFTPWLDLALEAVCLKAMALKPEYRYASPRDLADDVERWIADEPVAAYTEPFTRRARRWARKHRTALATSFSVAIVAGLLVGAYAWTTFERTRRADAAGLATLARAEFLAAEARKDNDPARWSEALAEARRSEAQLESGGAAAMARARARIADWEEALRVANRDRKMLADLDDARLQAANIKEGNFDMEAALEAGLAAARTYGIDLTKLTNEDAATRIRASRIAVDLVARIDEAISTRGASKALKERVSAVARLADPPGNDMRDRIARRDFEGLRRLVADESSRRELGARCRTVFSILANFDPTASLPVLEANHRDNRGDFWLTHDLAMACRNAQPPRLEAAIRHYYAAAALRPTSAGVFVNLGQALDSKGEIDAAIAAYREAIRLKPDYAEAHNNLGFALQAQGHLDPAVAEYEAAIRINPNFVLAHINLSLVLKDQGDLDRAIAECRIAIHIKPDYAEAHSNLGLALQAQGQVAQAIAEYRIALRIKPDLAAAQCNLGLALLQMGKFGESLESLEKGHALGSKQPGWRNPSEEWVRKARTLVELEPSLPAILKGETTPKDSDERLALANFCYTTQRFATSARFWGEAFAEKPALADDLAKGNRYNAACSASLAASGRGKDEPMPDDLAKVKLREQALGWLRADLAAWEKVLDGEKEPARKQEVAGQLAHWKEDSDLAGIRVEAALTRLPEREREAFRSLWIDVEALRKKAAGDGGR